MKIFKIVLTGGPCAGKTTALKAIKNHLEEQNIKYITIPETATELILNKMLPNSNYTYEFQTMVLKRQYAKEKEAINYAQKMYEQEEKVVILCDRGIFDNIAYLHSEEEFQKMLKEQQLEEENLLSSYNLVLNLFSLATCNPSYYSFNNEARLENVEEAKEADKKTANAWANHPNIKLLSSSISLQEEQEQIIQMIDSHLSNKDYIYKLKVPMKENKIQRNQSTESIVHNLYFPHPNTSIKIFEKKHIFLMQIVYEREFEKIIIEQRYINQGTFIQLLKKYPPLSTNIHSEKNFIENQTHYKIYYEDGKIFLDIQPNNLGKIILPNCCQSNQINLDSLYTNQEKLDNINSIKKLWRKN